MNIRTQKSRYRYSVALLLVAAICLVVILIAFPRTDPHQVTQVIETDENVTPVEMSRAEGKPEEEARLTRGGSETDPGDGEPRSTDTADAERTLSTQSKRSIYLLIDDVGNNLSHLDRFLALDVDITYAILPGRTFTRESAFRIEGSGHSYLLHQPMEPDGDEDPGTGAIYVGMDVSEIYAVLDTNLTALRNAVGINNHMGSRVTADPTSMENIMSYLADRGLVYVDSVTTDASVAQQAASSATVPFARRTAGFLDNHREYKQILENFEAGLRVADVEGEVILIGHVQSDALVKVIKENARAIQASGYTFKPLSEYPSFQLQ